MATRKLEVDWSILLQTNIFMFQCSELKILIKWYDDSVFLLLGIKS